MSIRATSEKRRRMRPQRTVFSRRTRAKRFVLLPRRWVVERSLVRQRPWTPVVVSSLLNVLNDASQFQVDIRSSLEATLSPS